MAGCYALVVAAGRGVRAGGDLPKQYRPLGGAPMLRHAAAAFAGHRDVAGTAFVIHPADDALYRSAVDGLPLLEPAAGGATRQESVRRGLEHLRAQAPDTVLIHDAARPFVDADTIGRVVRALERADGAIAAVPVVDTLKREAPDRESGTVQETVARDGLWRAQTPQGFRYPAILAAHAAAADRELTDDAAVAELARLTTVLVPGNEDNFKVTTDDDFARASRMLAAPTEMRTGIGFDVHRFGPGDHVWLCGIQVPHDAGLIGHSDADVGLHALTDALLGAIAAGDIGTHFPDDDPRWRDASSDRFLAEAVRMVRDRGGAVLGLDLTIICERPRIRPHHAGMIARVAEVAGLAPARVSIKATTTERLGFTGRGEGIAAQAVATVRLPAVEA